MIYTCKSVLCVDTFDLQWRCGCRVRVHTLVEPIYVSSPAGLSTGMESDDRMECETWEAKQRLGKIIIIRWSGYW